MKKERAEVKITIWEALIPLVALIGMLTANVFIF